MTRDPDCPQYDDCLDRAALLNMQMRCGDRCNRASILSAKPVPKRPYRRPENLTSRPRKPKAQKRKLKILAVPGHEEMTAAEIAGRLGWKVSYTRNLMGMYKIEYKRVRGRKG